MNHLDWNRGRVLFRDYGGATGRIVSSPIYAYRMAHSLSRKKLGDRVGRTAAVISNWEWCGVPRDGGYKLIRDRLGVEIEEPEANWRALDSEDVLRIGHAARAVWQLQDNQRHILRDIASEQRIWKRVDARIERQDAAEAARARIMASRAKTEEEREKAVRRLTRKQDEDELGRLYRSLDRVANAAAVQSLVERLNQQQEARNQAILERMEEDKEFADQWLVEHEDDPKLIESKDWRLYMSLPLTSNAHSDNWRDNTMDWASLHVTDVSDRAWLEDAVIEKIDKEKEGYFVQLNYNPLGYRVAVMNERGFLPAIAERRALDDLRDTRSHRWIRK